MAFLAAITIAVFRQLASHAFLNFDDGQFIYENQQLPDYQNWFRTGHR